MRTFNSKVSDNSVKIEYCRVQTDLGSAPYPDLLPHICRITGDDIYQYKETYEVLLDYPNIGGENIKEFGKMAIRNLLHVNIDVHSRILIAEFQGDGINVLKNCNHIVPTY